MLFFDVVAVFFAWITIKYSSPSTLHFALLKENNAFRVPAIQFICQVTVVELLLLFCPIGNWN